MRGRRPSRNLTHYWRVPATQGLSLLKADFTDQQFPPHAHHALVVAITEQGGALVNSRGSTFSAHPSKLLVFNPDEPHSSEMRESSIWRYRSFYFERPVLEKLRASAGIAHQPHFEGNAIADRWLTAKFAALHRMLEDDPFDRFRNEEAISEAIGLLYARHGDRNPLAAPLTRERAKVDRVIQLFRGRFSEALRLDEVASEVGLTQFQLIALFKREVGAAPYAMLTQFRLDAACRLLKRGASIAESAVAAGFYDQAALTRHFRSRFAITPRQFAPAP